MGFDLTGYVTVNERLKHAIQKWPDLRVQESEPQLINTDGQTFIQVTTTVWRSPDDTLPCIASCWEPYPGTTPYTRGSEQQNASTSSLGRCLGLMGIAIEAGMASKDEVVLARERTRETPTYEREQKTRGKQPASKAQMGYLKRLLQQQNVVMTAEELAELEADKFACSKKIEEMQDN
jgi:hypothetical protein